MEILGHPLRFNEDEHNHHLQYELDDILLRAKQGNMTELSLEQLANEIVMSVQGSMGIQLNDQEFQERIKMILHDDAYMDRISEVTPEGRVMLKQPGEFQAGSEDEVGDDAQQTQDEQSAKAQKLASRNVQNRSDGDEL